MFIYKTRSIVDISGFNDEAKGLNPKIELVLLFGEDQLRFTISDELTEQEDSELDALVLGFEDNTSLDSEPLIYSLVKAEAVHKHFHNINYKHELQSGLSLIPERESGTIKGEVREVVWYKDIDADKNPINPVIKVNITYYRDASGFALYRTTTRQWYNEDGSLNPESKITTKYYFVNKQDMVDEGIKRRTLLVNS